MVNLACFLEEQSAKVFLEGLLPRILPNETIVQYVVFEGKQDLEKRLLSKLKNWQKPDTVFLVMRDQDSSVCGTLKKKLAEICANAGRPNTLVRIACHELESFYFGDLLSVERALQLQIGSKKQARYRVPDDIVRPSEELIRVTKGAYQKIGSSREIGKIISLDDNTSTSFNNLISGIRRIVSA